MIERWQGQPGKMHELTKSHSTLRIVVTGEDYGKNLVIACLDPMFISGPTRWDNSQLEIRITESNSEEVVAIVDKHNGLKIISGSFEVKENLKL